jgi:DNA-binding response OmpR family regulator
VKIACIDDNPTNNLLLERALNSEYELQSFTNSEEFLNHPNYLDEFDLLLLDINMPGLSGIELTSRLRTEGSTQQVILISALVTVEDRLQGYDAGCDDYICKPFNVDELRRKIQVNKGLWESRQLQQKKLNSASEAAFTAMQQASEMGILVNFTRDLTRVTNVEDLSKISHDLLAHFGLSGIFRFQNDVYPGEVEASPLEVDLLMVTSDAPRIMEYGKRALYNAPYASVLIRNHPVENKELTGRLRDHLAIFIETLDDKVQSLNLRNDFDSQKRKAIYDSVQSLNESFSRVQDAAREVDEKLKSLIENGRIKITEILNGLSLHETEETQVIEAVEEMFDNFIELESSSMMMADGVDEIIAKMKQMLE